MVIRISSWSWNDSFLLHVDECGDDDCEWIDDKWEGGISDMGIWTTIGWWAVVGGGCGGGVSNDEALGMVGERL